MHGENIKESNIENNISEFTPYDFKKDIKLRIINLHIQTDLISKFYNDLYGEIPLSQKDNIISKSRLKENNKDKEQKDSNKDTLLGSTDNIIDKVNSDLEKLDEDIQDENKFPCNLCTKTYRSKENLNLHIMNIHLHKKPFSCQHCTKKFSNRMGVSYHMKAAHKL